MKIDVANRSDILNLVRMAREFHSLSRTSGTFCPSWAFSSLEEAMSSDDCTIFVLRQESGRAVGMLACQKHTSHVSSDLVCREIILWIDKEFRSYVNFKKLHDSFLNWSIENGCSSVVMSTIDTDDRIRILYERLGYHSRETLYERKI